MGWHDFRKLVVDHLARSGTFSSGMSLREAALADGVTAERIRQIEAKAIAKLRHPSRARHLIDFADYASYQTLPLQDGCRWLRPPAKYPRWCFRLDNSTGALDYPWQKER
jgi:hypothetical protein